MTDELSNSVVSCHQVKRGCGRPTLNYKAEEQFGEFSLMVSTGACYKPASGYS